MQHRHLWYQFVSKCNFTLYEIINKWRWRWWRQYCTMEEQKTRRKEKCRANKNFKATVIQFLYSIVCQTIGDDVWLSVQFACVRAACTFIFSNICRYGIGKISYVEFCFYFCTDFEAYKCSNFNVNRNFN